MTVTHVSVTDEVIREIAEQVSNSMRKRVPRWGGTAFDIAQGVEMYRGHLGISIPSSEMSLRDAARLSPADGGAPHDVGVYVLKREGKPVYVGRATEDRPSQATKGLRKRLQEHARGADTSGDEIRAHREELTVEFYSTGSAEAAKSLEARKINDLQTDKDNGGWNKRVERPLSFPPDTVRRTASNIGVGVMSDLALFSVGGAAMEIRDAWRNPEEMSLLDRCARLVRAIWQRFLASVKDRSLREIGTEAITAVASIVTARLKMAAVAVEKIVDALRRLWMDFVAGKLKTLADVVSACLKAVFAAVSVAAAFSVESQLAPQFATFPFGDVLAALCAAVVAGVMIVLGNRGIDYIVRSMFELFQGAEVARRRREEIEAFCAETLPQLVADRERLEALVETHIAGREALLDRTFADLQSARDTNDIDGFIKALNELHPLPWRTFDEFVDFMHSPEPLRL